MSTATFKTVKSIFLIDDALRNIPKDDLHAKYDFQPEESGSQLVASFNEMAAALKESKEIQRNLFEAANDPMLIIKEGGRIEDINKRITKIFGYNKESLIGNSLTTILTTQHIPLVKQAMAL